MAIRTRLEMGKLKHIQQTAAPNADRIVEASARAIEAGAKINASGRPGPEVDTNNLRGGITVQKTGQAKRRIGPTAEYAVFVELGTRHAPAYPFLKPAAEAELPNLKSKLKGIVT